MLGLLRRRLADLGTAKKLAIGFTLVLLLTALVAALAVLSLHALGQRFARLQEMSAINRDVLEVRQAEKDFALHGEKSDAERLRQRLAATLERVGRLKADGDADQALGMAEVEQVLAAYLEAFGRFEQSIQGRQLAWESASWSLNGAANSLDILQSSLAEDGAYALKESQGRDGEPLLQQAAQVAQVNRLVLQGLDEARSRLEARAGCAGGAAEIAARGAGAGRPAGAGDHRRCLRVGGQGRADQYPRFRRQARRVSRQPAPGAADVRRHGRACRAGDGACRP